MVIHIYQLKITLRNVKPAIWRRLLVPGNLNLQRLHLIIQDAMGWENCHMHSFEVGGEEYGVPDPDAWGPEVHNEKQYTLERLATIKDRFRYTYDFGDSWEHEIVVEKVMTGASIAPRCIDGARACPPEDCGGAWGYMELVQAVEDPKHARHDELIEWLPPGWAADRFDASLADRVVMRHRPEAGRPRPKTSKSKRPRARA